MKCDLCDGTVVDREGSYTIEFICWVSYLNPTYLTVEES